VSGNYKVRVMTESESVEVKVIGGRGRLVVLSEREVLQVEVPLIKSRDVKETEVMIGFLD
jgi:hypothetical protein